MAESNHGLFTILLNGRAAGPQSCVVASLDDVPNRLSVDFDDSADIVVDGKTGVIRTRLSLVRPPSCIVTNRIARQLLDNSSSSTCLAVMVRAGDSVRERILALEQWLGRAQSNTPPPNISGYGPGLTPSTDDFLLGAHAWFAASGHRHAAAIGEIMNTSLAGAAPVSAQMFRSALRGRYPEALIQFLEFPSTATAQPLLEHGATSGLDIAFGISWASAKCIDEQSDSSS